MSILDKAQIGSLVKVNIGQSRDRLTKEIINAINASPKGTICDFKITDGKGIGVILKFSNGKEQWFFDNEIEILDEEGNILEKNIDNNEKNNYILKQFKKVNYENKNKVSELLNPINFIVWLIASFKDIF